MKKTVTKIITWKRILLLLLITIPALFASGQTTSVNTGDNSIESSKQWINIDYVGDGIIGHKLDIHLPKKGKGPFPVVICIYGSAFFSNSSKAAVFQSGIGHVLLNAGFAVVSINHRSSRDAIFPAQIQDVKSAIRFVRANSKIYDLKGERIGITGWSSGGHLSSMAGTTSGIRSGEYKGFQVDLIGNSPNYSATSDEVQAVVDWFGPTDFLRMDSCGSTMNHNDAKSPESTLVGGLIQENKEKVRLADPAFYARHTTPPFLIFHGDKDPLVPFCESEYFYGELKSKDVKATFIPVPGGGHGPGVMIDKYYEMMVKFFKEYIK
jgi:acetyl esterase/lipase